MNDEWRRQRRKIEKKEASLVCEKMRIANARSNRNMISKMGVSGIKIMADEVAYILTRTESSSLT